MTPKLDCQIDESIETDVDFWIEQKHADDEAEEKWHDQSWSD